MTSAWWKLKGFQWVTLAAQFETSRYVKTAHPHTLTKIIIFMNGMNMSERLYEDVLEMLWSYCDVL